MPEDSENEAITLPSIDNEWFNVFGLTRGVTSIIGSRNLLVIGKQAQEKDQTDIPQDQFGSGKGCVKQHLHR